MVRPYLERRHPRLLQGDPAQLIDSAQVGYSRLEGALEGVRLFAHIMQLGGAECRDQLLVRGQDAGIASERRDKRRFLIRAWHTCCPQIVGERVV
jgi:hypothetical protein